MTHVHFTPKADTMSPISVSETLRLPLLLGAVRLVERFGFRTGTMSHSKHC